MHKRLTLIAAACLMSGSALANDWTGWYLGGHVGRADGSADSRVTLDGQWASESQALRDDVTANWSTNQDPSGTAYGLQYGYNHQFASGFVLGGELAYSSLNADESRQTGPVATAPFPSLTYDYLNSAEFDDQWSVRMRIGGASGQHLFYGIIGWTQVKVRGEAGVVSNGNYLKYGSTSGSESGVEWGLGYEYDFGNQWSLRLDYTRTDLGDVDYVTEYVPGSSFVSPEYLESVNLDSDLSAWRLGLSYRF